MTLRDKLTAEFQRIYFAKERKGSLFEDLADAAIALMKAAK